MKHSIWPVTGLAVLFAFSARAEDPPPFPDFTFKMGKPPAADAKKRIDVQIEPAGPQDGPAEQPGPAAALSDPAPSRHAWFWADVPDGMETGAARRLKAALSRLSAAAPGKIAQPRLESLRGIAREQGAHVLRATIGTRVSPALALAVIAVESGGDPAARSEKGALGLMQLMPDTADRFGVTDRRAPADSIAGGVAYLDWLIDEFDGDAILALAGYNAGESAVRAHGGVPPFAETRDYVPKVLAAYRVAAALCQTPPELITDGCALAVALK
ncbi:lytic transglycosylase domain-containing protein [Roseovarius salinarum]|uniref:lytic transglycosylase domain-containing protein n=1 Tax=Roseovarius salinarum TaxID=1981892 RepID=UPI000C3279E4|nr:lytic transglycosylase domain-containing protein [Roseovarius salinarum]